MIIGTRTSEARVDINNISFIVYYNITLYYNKTLYIIMSFKEYLLELDINPNEYLKEARKKAKKYNYNYTTLKYSDKDNKKLMILNPETNKYIHFGANRYKDYIIYKTLYNKEIANKKAFNYHSRAYNIYETSAKYSPSALSFIIIW